MRLRTLEIQIFPQSPRLSRKQEVKIPTWRSTLGKKCNQWMVIKLLKIAENLCFRTLKIQNFLGALKRAPNPTPSWSDFPEHKKLKYQSFKGLILGGNPSNIYLKQLGNCVLEYLKFKIFLGPLSGPQSQRRLRSSISTTN